MDFDYTHILSLDNLSKFLNQGERTAITKKSLGHEDVVISDKAKKALDFIKHHNWKPPKQKYGQDRLLYFQTITGSWSLIEKYNHPILTEIQKLK